MRIGYTEVLSPIELIARELEFKKGQKWHSLGETMLLDFDNGESCGLASSCIPVRIVHAYE